MALDLTELMERDGFKLTDYFGTMAESFYVNGKAYSIPTKLDQYGIVINKDMFDAAGIEVPTEWTYDEFREIAKKLTHGEGQDKVYGMFWNSQQDLTYLFTYLVAQTNGGDPFYLSLIHIQMCIRDSPGCVSYMFDKKGQIIIDKEECEMDADELMMVALDAGAEDFSEEEDSYEVLTAPDDFSTVREALENAGIPMAQADVTMIPQTWVELTSDEDIKKINRTLDLLDEDDDVQAVYHNWDTDER